MGTKTSPSTLQKQGDYKKQRSAGEQKEQQCHHQHAEENRARTPSLPPPPPLPNTPFLQHTQAVTSSSTENQQSAFQQQQQQRPQQPVGQRRVALLLPTDAANTSTMLPNNSSSRQQKQEPVSSIPQRKQQRQQQQQQQTALLEILQQLSAKPTSRVRVSRQRGKRLLSPQRRSSSDSDMAPSQQPLASLDCVHTQPSPPPPPPPPSAPQAQSAHEQVCEEGERVLENDVIAMVVEDDDVGGGNDAKVDSRNGERRLEVDGTAADHGANMIVDEDDDDHDGGGRVSSDCLVTVQQDEKPSVMVVIDGGDGGAGGTSTLDFQGEREEIPRHRALGPALPAHMTSGALQLQTGRADEDAGDDATQKNQEEREQDQSRFLPHVDEEAPIVVANDHDDTGTGGGDDDRRAFEEQLPQQQQQKAEGLPEGITTAADDLTAQQQQLRPQEVDVPAVVPQQQSKHQHKQYHRIVPPYGEESLAISNPGATVFVSDGSNAAAAAIAIAAIEEAASKATALVAAAKHVHDFKGKLAEMSDAEASGHVSLPPLPCSSPDSGENRCWESHLRISENMASSACTSGPYEPLMSVDDVAAFDNMLSEEAPGGGLPTSNSRTGTHLS